MADTQLYTKLSGLSDQMKLEVENFIDYLRYKSKIKKAARKRISGKAKGRIIINDNFDDPIPGFEEYQ